MAKNLLLLLLPTFQPGEPWLVWKLVSGSASASSPTLPVIQSKSRVAAEILADDARVELMLGDQHSLGQRVGRVVRQYRDLDLAQYVAAIQLGSNQVHRRAGELVAGCEAGLVRIQALMLWQERRVDIDDPAFPAGEEIVGNDAHEAGQRDEIDVRRLQRLRCSLSQ